MAFRKLQNIRALYQMAQIREYPHLLGCSMNHSSGISNVPKLNCWKVPSYLYNDHDTRPWTRGNSMMLRSAMVAELATFSNGTRSATTQAKVPAQARQVGTQITSLSPGFIYDPYAPRERISFWKRWFTRSGWRRTKEDIIIELKSAYAINKLRKSGYSKQKFYKEAVDLYREINTLIANGDKKSLRKAVTENMYSTLKNEITRRESLWSNVYWQLIEPIVKIRTLRARLIGVDKNNLNKVFIQLTLDFLSKQKFEAYDSKGKVVAGDKSKEVLVRDIWVFEKSLFHTGAYWRLCGRIAI